MFFSKFFSSDKGVKDDKKVGQEDTKNLNNTVKTEPKKGLLAKIKGVKHIEIIIAVIAVAIMLFIYFVNFGGGGSAENSRPPPPEAGETYSDYTRRMQAEITQIVSAMEGAGQARVLISWESSVELILAHSTNTGPSSSTSTPILVNTNGMSRPIVTKEIYPRALGVVVVVEGGQDPRLRVNIIMSISVLLSLNPEKILVFAMRS